MGLRLISLLATCTKFIRKAILATFYSKKEYAYTATHKTATQCFRYNYSVGQKVTDFENFQSRISKEKFGSFEHPISQCNVETHIGWGGIFLNGEVYIRGLLGNVSVKEKWKSVNISPSWRLSGVFMTRGVGLCLYQRDHNIKSSASSYTKNMHGFYTLHALMHALVSNFDEATIKRRIPWARFTKYLTIHRRIILCFS